MVITASIQGPAEALRRLAEGRDPEAWAWLLTVMGPEIQRMGTRLTGDAMTADDAVQECLLLLRDHAGQFRPRADPDHDARLWIMRVAATTALKLRRSQLRRLSHERGAPQPAPGAQAMDTLERDETALQLQTALSQLREQERAPIVLHVVTGLTVPETAEVLGWPAGTVKVRIHRGLNRLRERLHRCGCDLSAAAIWQGFAAGPPVPLLPHASALLTAPVSPSALPSAALGLPGIGLAPVLPMALLSKVLLGLLALVVIAATGIAVLHGRSSSLPTRSPPSRAAPLVDAPAQAAAPQADAPPVPQPGGSGDSEDADPQPRAWLDDAEYARRRLPYLQGMPAAEEVAHTRPAWGLLIRAIPPHPAQAAALDLQAGDLLLMQDGMPLEEVADLKAVDHVRTVSLLRPSTGQTRDVKVAPGPIGIIAGPDWRPELPVLAGEPRSVARDDLYVACVARDRDRQLAETALAHAAAAHRTQEPYWSVFAQLLLDSGRYGGAIRAIHRADATTDFGQIPPLCRIWTEASLAGARYDEAGHPPRYMALNAPAHPVPLSAADRARCLPSTAAADRIGQALRRPGTVDKAGPIEQGLAAGDGTHGGAWSWDDPAWSYIMTTPFRPVHDQVVSFDLELPAPAPDEGYPALRLGFLDHDPSQGFLMLTAGHPLEEPIDVILHASGYCELGARGLAVVTLHPATMTEGKRHPLHVALWWFHDWWEFDLDGVPMAYGPALEPVRQPLQLFLESFTGSGRITAFTCRDLSDAPAQPHAGGF